MVTHQTAHEMKIKKIDNSKSQKLTSRKEDFAFKYLHKQFPWLPESDIMKAIEIKGPNAEHVLKYLEGKSDKGKTFEDLD